MTRLNMEKVSNNRTKMSIKRVLDLVNMIVQLMGTIRPDNKSQGSVRMTSQITEERNANYVKMT